METEKLLMQHGEVAGGSVTVGAPRNYPLQMSTQKNTAVLEDTLHLVEKCPPPMENVAVKVTQSPVAFFLDHHESVDSNDSGVSTSSNSVRTSGDLTKMVLRKMRHPSVDSEQGPDCGFTDGVVEPICIPSVEMFNAPSPIFDDGFGDDGSMSCRHSSFGGMTQFKKQNSIEGASSLPRRRSNDSDSDVSLNSFGQRRHSDPLKHLGHKVSKGAKKLLNKMSHLHHSGSQHEMLELHVKKEVVSPMDPVEAETTRCIIDAFLTQGQVIATTELEEELDLTQAEPLTHLNNARAELASLVATAFEAVHDNQEVQNVAKVMTHDLAECVYAAPVQCSSSTPVPEIHVTMNGKPTSGGCMGKTQRHYPTMDAGLSPRTDNDVPLPPAISPDIQPKSFFANPEIPQVKPQVATIPLKKMDQLNCTVSCSLVDNSETTPSPKLRRFSDASPYRRW